ncbi:hypothetical protein PISMIDRAFT_690668 [Pisolithus microcarpus 441]|uniref:Uncharacterized protein n=1 Tax=Pisolithus microcarpus 441 TaxID=765257 RepID=A0A0C9YSS1_9AGAM|nr:hypothetical protein BKA83DRAFT_690668 [Pisolithus microcarpus]KIK10973.1 hypothetical protein PISMIDRAFT_690668 [Pisolithus microcarpus 441]
MRQLTGKLWAPVVVAVHVALRHLSLLFTVFLSPNRSRRSFVTSYVGFDPGLNAQDNNK